MRSSFKLLLAMLFSLVVLAGCGGGGGSSSPPTATTYSIAGTVTSSGVALSGATVALSGASTATTTTDASGNYSFAGLANGSYTVTTSKTGYAFTPSSSAVNVSGANVTGQDFTAAQATATYSISGTVSGASGVTIALSGANTGSVVSGAGGAYTFTGLAAGTYTLTPSLAGYTFSPSNKSVTITTASSTGNNFTATAIPVTYSISGTVSGAIKAGVTITVTGAASPAPVTTDSNGNYSVTGLADGNYTVTPSLTGYTFSPSSTAVTVSGANATGKNFTSTANAAPTYTLSGTVTGPYVEGVTISLTGGASTTTNASGNYSFTGLAAGTYTVTPSLPGYTYSPASPSVTVNANTTQNFTASSAVASSSVSGTISYAGSQTGGIHIRVHDATCTANCQIYADVFLHNQGGSFTNVPFTIRGVRASNGPGTPAQYVLQAFIGAVQSGAINASDPQGKSATTFTTTAGTNVAGLSITVADKTPAAPTAPTGVSAFPSDGAALIQYTAPVDSTGKELATSYTLSWGTTNTASGGGTANFVANGTNQDVYFLNGLTNGQQLYFKLTATNGTGSATSAVAGPVTIGATSGANTVSGTVTFSGTATGPMTVGVYDNTNGTIYYTTIANPSSPQSYSVSGIPNGTYNNFAEIDMDNSHTINAGDITNTGNNAAPSITVSGNTTGNITLSSAAATVKVNTNHQFDGTNDNYNLVLSTNNGTKHLVGATMVSGPNVPVPFDMGPINNNELWIYLGATSPKVGDTYTFQATYSDGTTGTLTGSVTAVLGQSSMAQTLTTSTAAPNSAGAPLFSWAAPSSPPPSYTYNLSVYGTSSGPAANWNYPNRSDMPSSQTSVVYNVDGNASPASLTTGTYGWQVQVTDASGNSATRQSTYTVP